MQRIPVALAFVLLSACSQGDEPAESEPGPKSLPRHEQVFCSLAGAVDFTGDCTVERRTAGGRQVLIVRHPDGGFRRFEIGRDGKGMVSADGADEAGVAPNGNLLDVRVGRDRYRFPLERESDANPE